MATITVNVPDETADLFRNVVKRTVGTGKGKLGSALNEAMTAWAEEKRQKELGERIIKTMKKGFKMGKILYKNREELYDRRIFFN